jgi:hypothetical protein
MGTFAGATEQYGDPLSFVHPKDNDFNKARFNELLLDPRLKLTQAQRRRLQEEIDNLVGTLLLGQEKAKDSPKKKASSKQPAHPKRPTHRRPGTR